MNSTFQPDSHPDAESLNAFAEQALPERERGQILAHLAGCSRCRQVVFLAQEAASEFAMQEAAASRPELDRAAAYELVVAMAAAPEPMAAVVAAGGRMSGKRQSWWLGGWRLAWIPAAALASIIGLVVFVHVRQVRLGFESGVKFALNEPQAVPRPQPKPAEPQPANRAAMEKPQAAAPPIAAKASKAKTLIASAGLPSEAFSAPPEPARFVAGGMEMSRSELNRARPLPQPQGQGAGMQLHGTVFPQAAPAPAAAARPELAASANSFNDTSAGTPSATVLSAAGKVKVSRSVSAGAMAPQPALESASVGSFVSSQPMPELRADGLATRKAKVTLPSGLRAVSKVTAQHRTLAIDSSGALFLSEDSGSKWEPVARQWSGRAVAVRLQDGLKMSGAVTAEAKAAGAENEPGKSELGAEAAPDAVFEIVNDSDLVWISADGKTWKAK